MKKSNNPYSKGLKSLYWLLIFIAFSSIVYLLVEGLTNAHIGYTEQSNEQTSVSSLDDKKWT